MANCGPRTGALGEPYSICSEAYTSGSLPRTGDEIKHYDVNLPYQRIVLGELLKLRHSNTMHVLIYTLLHQGFSANDYVDYCHHRSTHYIRTKKFLYTCRKGEVRRVQHNQVKTP